MRLLFALFWLLIPGSVLADPETPPQLLLVSQRVSEVSFEGDPLPEAARAKFSSLAGRDFSASAVRAAILWSHENGIDSLIQVRATHVPNGIALRISSHRKIRISALTFSGNSTVTGNVLAQQIDLKEDMEFEAELARQAVQKINLFYSKQGYLAADVGYFFDPQKRVLKFQIREGDPTLISGISISEISSVERKDLKSRYEKEIMDAFALRVGDRIQRDRVLDGVQAIKDWLRDHDFLLARDPVLEYKVAEDGKVGIFINISYGPRIRYGFRGNTRFSYRELMLLVSDVKEVA